MKNTKILAFAICTAVLSVQNSAAAVENLGPRQVVSLGCHNTDGTCYVSLDGAAFGSTLGCSVTNEFRFDNGDTAIGMRAYASLLAAMLKGRSVSVTLNECTIQGSPKLRYFSIN